MKRGSSEGSENWEGSGSWGSSEFWENSGSSEFWEFSEGSESSEFSESSENSSKKALPPLLHELPPDCVPSPALMPLPALPVMVMLMVPALRAMFSPFKPLADFTSLDMVVGAALLLMVSSPPLVTMS